MTYLNKLTAIAMLGSFTVTSCQTTDPYTGEQKMSKTAGGALLGGALGAAAGALTGDGGSDSRKRAAIGAGIGALAGGGVGAYMDRQAAELRRELEGTGVGIQRYGNNISLVMPGDVTFSTGSSGIRGEFFPTLSSVAKVLDKYDKTRVAVTGHTDNVGGRDYNYRLSQARASSVARYLQTQGVEGQRFIVSGEGYENPIASNESEAGRQANRRVTIQLAPM